MKISVVVKNGKVESITKDDCKKNWIEVDPNNPPSLKKHLLTLVNNYKKGTPLSKSIEVIAPSGQQWDRMTAEQRSELLELVEWVGDSHYPTAEEYVKYMESMYPKNPIGRV